MVGRLIRGGMFALVAMSPAILSPASGQSRALQSLEIAARALKPGQYVWRDLNPAAGSVAVIVSVPMQTAFVYRDTRLVGVASVSTGKRSKATPTGDYTILQKRVFHRSNLYSNAPMPHMQRLTWDGIALHGGHNPGYPASHGCIRLPPAFAALLYNVTQMGGAVGIVSDDNVAPPPPDAVPELIAQTSALVGPRYATVTWAPAAPLIDDDRMIVPDARLDLPARRG